MVRRPQHRSLRRRQQPDEDPERILGNARDAHLTAPAEASIGMPPTSLVVPRFEAATSSCMRAPSGLRCPRRSRKHHAPRGVGHGLESIAEGRRSGRRGADGCGAAAGDRPSRPHSGPGKRRHRRELAVRTRLPGRLAAPVRVHRPRLRRRRRRLASDVQRARRVVGVQGPAQRHLDRELRGERGVEWRQHCSRPGGRDRRQILLRPRDALGHRRRQLHHRHRGGHLPV